MRIILIVLILLIAAGTCFGFYIRPEDYRAGELCIGISIAALFFLWMPLFIFHRWRKRSFKDYMLTKENIDKMREEGRKKNL
ncbi:hypothetical protein [Altibacter sp. HG106]|uniref:hypothetical protein n=1 Tax=Altibacter sp. HG106 TaxID=3023937 RepID=UPI00234FD759|nr:hypothetical protein [Altibacter sp. HG106]MDC7994761.1 hypothetical protein [Altibacter sp. HG106]